MGKKERAEPKRRKSAPPKPLKNKGLYKILEPGRNILFKNTDPESRRGGSKRGR